MIQACNFARNTKFVHKQHIPSFQQLRADFYVRKKSQQKNQSHQITDTESVTVLTGYMAIDLQ